MHSYRRIVVASVATSMLTAIGLGGPRPALADVTAPPGIERCRSLPGLLPADLRGEYRIASAVSRGAPPATAACEFTGRVPAAGTFRLAVPAGPWNGRLSEVACDGWCSPDAAAVCPGLVSRGYACLTRAGRFQLSDAHRAVSAAKQVLATYYGTPVAASILLGCSRGGGEALRRAAADPSDFNGIVAGAPILDERDTYRRLLWIIGTLRARSGASVLRLTDLSLLHAEALAACDAADGLADGIISDPLRCGLRLPALRCTAERQRPCLGDAQIEAAGQMYRQAGQAGAESGHYGGQLPGSELRWARFTGADGRALERELQRRLQELGPERSDAESPQAVLTGFGPFTKAGGKLLLFQGLADPLVSPRAVAIAYEQLSRSLGGPLRSAGNVRLFLVPGMEHCSGGDGAYQLDFLRSIETWVARGAGRPPDDMIGFHPRTGPAPGGSLFAPVALDPGQAAFSGWTLGATVTLEQARELPHSAFSRPVFLYPSPTRYKGVGDPQFWRSFYSPNDYPFLLE